MVLEAKTIALLIFLGVVVGFCRCWSKIPKDKLDPKLQVNISTGTLQGKLMPISNNNGSYYAFFGIPYAKPPVGRLRFTAPQPPAKWTDVLDARKERSMCTQMGRGSDNCLFLNVYSPQIKVQEGQALFPVMVWIHGGGFIYGSSEHSVYGPQHLVQRDVILVALNYRLGVQGFLSTGDMASPGNYGLKDQVQALRWVKENVRHFGGDASRITIFGESAGAASVQYLLQSPMAQGLFQGAISQSGSALAPYALDRDPKKTAFEIGSLLGIDTNDTAELVEQLRMVPNEELRTAPADYILQHINDLYNGLPSAAIEPEHDGAFLSQPSYLTLLSGNLTKVPYMLGFTSLEMAALLRVWDVLKGILEKFDGEPALLVHNFAKINYETKRKIALEIMSYYFANRSMANETPGEVIATYITDDQFVRPACQTAKMYSKYAPVYLYRFSYQGGTNRTFNGTAHTEDIRYLFSGESAPKLETEKDFKVREKMLRLWTNFAKTRNPTPVQDDLLDNVTWPKMFGNDQARSSEVLLDINEHLSVMENPRREAMDFWDDIERKYGYSSYLTV